MPLEVLFICLHVCFLPSSIFHPPLLLKLSLTISSFLPSYEKERRFGFWSANELMERQNISQVFISRPCWRISLLLGVYPLISEEINENLSIQSSHLRPPRWRQAATRAEPTGTPVGDVVYRRLLLRSPHFTVCMRTVSPWSTKLKAAVVIKSQKKPTD